MNRLACCFLVLFGFGFGLTGSAQAPSDESILREPVLPGGQQANAPIDRSEAAENWDSPPGSGIGCCVVASCKANLNYLDLPKHGDAIKRVSLTAMGGHDPDKLDRQLSQARQTHPDLAWTQWWDGNESKLLEWSASGRPIGVTYAWGKPYGNRKIAHMVSGIHFDTKWAMILDNNFTTQYSLMPWPEFLRRWKAMGGGWGVVFTCGRPKRPPMPLLPISLTADEAAIWGGSALLVVAAFFLLWRRK